MADRVVPGPVEGSASIREAVCINTKKIFDSCRDKDCVDDLRVYPTVTSQSYIENALSIRPRSAELLYVDVNVEPIGFNRGYYTVDCTYFYRVICETFPICLHCKLVDSECLLPTDIEQRRIPEFISAAFSEALVLTDTARRWFVTIGQFSIIRLERDTQLLIPAYDYCMPDKECPGVASDEDPCMLFSRIRFPVEEFFPPDSVCECDDYRTIASKKK